MLKSSFIDRGLSVLASVASVLLIVTSTVTQVAAQKDYPNRPLEMIVTFAPGGASDTSARALAPYMGEYLKESIVIKNAPPPRTGTDIFSRSRPDGYTIANLAGVAVASDETFYNVRFKAREFAWIGAHAATPGVLFASAGKGIKTFEDLARLGKERPVKIGAFSIFSSSSIAAMTALEEKKIPYTFVTGFRGAAPAVTALVRGDVDVVGTTMASGMPFYKSGDVWPVVVMQEEPDPRIPEALSLVQADLTPSIAYVGSVHFALAAPPGTSPELVKTLAAALKDTLADARYIDKINRVGYEVRFIPPDQMKAWLDTIYTSFEKMKPLVEAMRKN